MNKIEIMKHYFKTKYLRKFKTRKQLEHYQKIQMKKHMEFVFKHSAFYREFYQAKITHFDGNLEHLPIISKREMMENFNTLNTANMNKDQAYQLALEAEKTRDFSPKLNGISIGLSSGTSGNRGIFLISDKESAKWVGTVLAKLLPGHLFERHKIAFFLRANNNLYSSTENGRITFHYFDLLDEFASHQEKLNDLQPTIIIGPPSFLRLLAEWQEQKIINVTPSKIVSVAEVLEDLDKYYIENIYNQKLHQVYQSTEGFLAATCSHGTLHMNEDIVMIHKEYLDEAKGIFVPIISDFTRTTQPIIRYRLNDILIESKTSCPCGSPYLALERIDGRCDDLFWGLKNTSSDICTLFPDFIRRAIMFASDKIVEYKVIQVDMLNINIQLKVNGQLEEVKEDVRAEMVKLWKSYELIIPSFSFLTYDLKPSDKKLKRIESLIKENHHDQNV
ncbi:putative adenylate-forming enzyme [Metabacillus crassostreae]|uniref:F390 synthetase-related protein n=1 Tax=Metabacillus crassostreae TaxID=929098 RepID=UPI00195A6265|nr:F390 synthetase-related protein [Metabacillus crassostreae]MBM7603189.1 putative adenylate-forming enzyme [Metabacillus crassostreae]